MSIKVIIIEDEPNSISVLENLIDKADQDIEILAHAATVQDGISIINKHRPELVFMDIHLLDGVSFEIIENTEYSNYEVIFITAYHQHAIRAFDIAAIHYLMKPVKLELLNEAIERYLDQNNDIELTERMSIVNSSLKNDNKKIMLPVLDGLTIVDIENVVRCHSNNSYTTFHMSDNTQLTVSRGIAFYDNLLTPLTFVRIHAKHLINLAHVEKYTKGRGGSINFTDGSHIEIARNRRNEFLYRLSQFACGNGFPT